MKKILLLIMTLLLLTSCNLKKKEKEKIEYERDPLVYIEKLKNFTPRPKNKNNTVDNEEFNDLLDRFFKESYEDGFMHMHFSMDDYRSFGIEKPPVDLGEVKYALDEESFDYYAGILDELAKFDFDSLSYQQQIDYENIEYSNLETLADMCYYRYHFLLTSNNNAADDLFVTFSDYTFYDKESVDDYITCLKDIDRYLDDVMTYTADQAAAGYPLTNAWIDYTKELCDRSTSDPENSEFILSFDKRIATLDFLTDQEKEDYKAENKKIVLEEVVPAYKKLAKEVQKYRGKAKDDDYLLYKLDKNYAELQFMLAFSCNKSIDEIYADVEDAYSLLEAEFVSVYYDELSNNQFNAALNGEIDVLKLDHKGMLEYLRTHNGDYFPDLGDVEYEVSYLNPDTASNGVIAYYLHPLLDNLDQNIIRVNPNNHDDSYSVYGTLAHEGFPGHLYQSVYFYRTDPKPYRTCLGYSGYTEGWAVYATYYAFRSLGITDYASAALFYLDNYYFFMYSLIDMQIDYYGWSVDEVYNYFKENSVLASTFTKRNISNIVDYVVENQCSFCYYGSATNFFLMRDRAAKEMGNNFNIRDFNAQMLVNGPLPFAMMEQITDEYIASAQS
ncbi:MAG: DUF885 domain-containing protein [Erysipelotrichaceae bacterium]|nr:DUF885 domain-containing protein [Erysipelotrichaceae bacterium]